MNQIEEIILVGDGHTVSRLPEILANRGLRVRAIGPASSVLSRSRFVNDVTLLGNKETFPGLFIKCSEFFPSSSRLFILSDDELVSRVRESSHVDRDVLGILPFLRAPGRKIAGSKTGLAAAIIEMGIPSPETRVFDNPAAALEFKSSLTGRWCMKADEGGGGRFIIPDLIQHGHHGLEESWFPVLVQRWVPGPTISVEALFLDGRLAGWTYSVLTGLVRLNGPSFCRQFRRPFAYDFLTSLDTFGSFVGGHGFFSCTFLWDGDSKQHLLIEADARPNAWHQFGPQLGVDWALKIRARGQLEGLSSSSESHRSVEVYLWFRSVQHAVVSGSLAPLLAWWRRSPGTYEFRNRMDSLVNRWECRELRGFIVRHLKEFIKRAVLRLRKG